MPETDLPELELLAPTWVDELRRLGVSTSAELALWRDDHTVPPALERVEMMRRWARGEVRIADLGRELGVAHSRVQSLLTVTVLQVIEPPRRVRRPSSLRLQRLLGPGGERSEPARPALE